MSIRDRISGLLKRQPNNLIPVKAVFNSDTGLIEYEAVKGELKRDKNKEPAQKSLGGMSSWINYSNAYGRGADLSEDAYGLVLAATTVVAVSRGLSFWETTIGGLEWDIKQIEGDKEVVIASSKDRRPKHSFHAALIRHNHRYYRDLIPLMVMSDKLHGETYVERIVNKERIDGQPIGSDLRWLNPIAMQIRDNDRDGAIDEFFYTPAGGTPVTFMPAEIAYRIYGINPGDDLRGLGVVQPAISAINIDRNLKRSISAFFRNYALPAAIISPSGEMAHLGPTEKEALEKFFRDFTKGVDNQHRVAVSPVKSQVDTFDQPDIDKQYSLHEPLVREIFLSMGVPPAIAGDPSMSKFHDGVPVFENWWGATGIPYAHDLERYITGQLVAFLEPGSDAWFEFDLSAFDQINEQDEIASRVLGNDVNTGYLSLNEARVARGYETDKALDNLFMVGGVLTPRHELAALSIPQAPNGSVSDENTGEEVESGKGVAVPQEQVFGYHIETGIVTIDEARAQLSLPPIGGKEESENVIDLQALQAKLAVMVTASQAGLSTDEAALMVDLEIPEVAEDDTATGTQPDTLDTKSIETWPTRALAELKSWKKVHKAKKSRAFVPEHTLGDIADSIQKAIDDKGDVDAAFDSAFTLLRQPGLKALEKAFISLIVSLATNDAEGVVKSLQSIRLDFEGDFENVISAIRSGGLDDRGRAGRQLRQILRTFGSRLFRQGLTDAGVLDDPTDEEQATIQGLIRESSKFVGNLTKVLITDDGITDVQAAGKAAMWFNRSMIGFYYEGFESGARNQMMLFSGSAGKDGCNTCKRLDGQRHRMKDWSKKKLRPKVDGHNYDCGGHNCKHTLVPVAARARGKW